MLPLYQPRATSPWCLGFLPTPGWASVTPTPAVPNVMATKAGVHEGTVVLGGPERKTVEALVRRGIANYEAEYVLNEKYSYYAYRFTFRLNLETHWEPSSGLKSARDLVDNLKPGWTNNKLSRVRTFHGGPWDARQLHLPLGGLATDLDTEHGGTDANKRDVARQVGRLNVADLEIWDRA
jgi:hypothetical protein